MAIIKCPECSGQISSTVKNCIHCGCPIFVCDECGHIEVSNTKTCKICGYAKESAEESCSIQDAAQYKTLTSTAECWENEKFYLKVGTYNIGCFGLLFTSIVLCIIAVITTLTPDSLEAFQRYNDLISNVKILLIFSAVAFSLSSILMEFQEYLRASSLQVWLRGKKLDALALLDEEFTNGFSTKSPREIVNSALYISTAIKTKKYDTDVFSKVNEMKIAIFSALAGVLSSILVCIFLYLNAEAILSAKVLDQKFTFDSIQKLWVGILAIAVYIIKCFTSHFLNKKAVENDGNWMQEYLPQHMEKYTKYVKNADEYLAEHIVDID